MRALHAPELQGKYLLNPVFKARTRLFLQLLAAVWLILGFYCVFYGYMGAKFSFVVVLSGFFILSPLSLWLEKNRHSNSARLLFVLSCNYYIHASSLGMLHKVGAEYYFLPSTMIPLLVFEGKQKKFIYFSISLAFMCWVLIFIEGSNFLPPAWTIESAPFELIKSVNFVGAFIISIIFLSRFMRSNFQLKDILVGHAKRETQRLMKLSQQLGDAQRVGKIGNWSFHIASKRIQWSKQMYQLFPEDEQLGPPSFERLKSTIHSADVQRWQESVERCVQDGAPYVIRFRVCFPQDKVLWIETCTQGQINEQGQCVEIFGTCQDVTERVLADEQLKLERVKSTHNAKLASLGEMSAGMAHEINNPLAIIAGNAILLEKFRDQPDKFSAKIDSITKAAARIEKIVKGLKRFARVTGDRQRKMESVSAIITESLVLIDAKAKRFSVPVKTSIENDYFLSCDVVEIEQVLVNLINNSLYAVQELPQPWVELRVFSKDRDLFVQVIDAGAGISPELELKLFEPFFTTKPVGEGTGLGLSIAQGILAEHRATLSLNRSFPNTCFEIRFIDQALTKGSRHAA